MFVLSGMCCKMHVVVSEPSELIG